MRRHDRHRILPHLGHLSHHDAAMLCGVSVSTIRRDREEITPIHHTIPDNPTLRGKLAGNIRALEAGSRDPATANAITNALRTLSEMLRDKIEDIDLDALYTEDHERHMNDGQDP